MKSVEDIAREILKNYDTRACIGLCLGLEGLISQALTVEREKVKELEKELEFRQELVKSFSVYQEKFVKATALLRRMVKVGHELADIVNCKGDYKELLDYMEVETEAESFLEGEK